MGPIHCPKMSVSNYQYMLYNIPEKRRYHIMGEAGKHTTPHKKTTQNFNITTSSVPIPSNWSLPFWFFEQNLVWIYHLSHAWTIKKQVEDYHIQQSINKTSNQGLVFLSLTFKSSASAATLSFFFFRIYVRFILGFLLFSAGPWSALSVSLLQAATSYLNVNFVKQIFLFDL